MNPVQPVSSRSLWSYVNPFKIWDFVLSIWSPKESQWGDRNVVVCKDFDREWIEVDIRSNLADLLNQTSRPYPMGKVGTIAYAKTFFSDITRSGYPDQFFIDEQEVQPPKTVEEILARLLNAAGGDAEKVALWTQIWNYRLKSILYDTLVEAFFEEYTMKPVCGRNDYLSVKISLDSRKNSLSCAIKGLIKHAIDDSRPLEVISMNVSYKAEFSFDSAMGVADQTIRFL